MSDNNDDNDDRAVALAEKIHLLIIEDGPHDTDMAIWALAAVAANIIFVSSQSKHRPWLATKTGELIAHILLDLEVGKKCLTN